jgi:flap endonuclease-1
MGVKGLYKLLQQKAPDSIKLVQLQSYVGKTVAIDASILLYQFLALPNKITNKRLEDINHIQGFLYRTLTMLEAGVVPVFVFDGCPPKAKEATIEQRKLNKEKNSTCNINFNLVDDVKKMFTLMGVFQIQAKSEAEASAAILAKNGKVSAVVSEDLDSLVFGAPIVLRKFAQGSTTKDKNQAVEINLLVVLQQLNITFAQFIDLCILCGTDYTKSTLRNIGPIKALELIKTQTTIENIIKFNNIEASPEFDFATARKEFLKPKVSSAVVKGKFNSDKLTQFLIDKGLDIKKINTAVSRLKTLHAS